MLARQDVRSPAGRTISTYLREREDTSEVSMVGTPQNFESDLLASIQRAAGGISYNFNLN